MTKVYRGPDTPKGNITDGDVWIEEELFIQIKCPRCDCELGVSKTVLECDDDLSCWMCGEIYNKEELKC